jgi:hypothetical protein
VESNAVAGDTVNAASIDGPKIDIALTGAFKPIPRLFLGAHIGLTSYIIGDAGQRFNPRARTSCIDARYSLDACELDDQGAALPSAAGRYLLFALHLGAAIGFDY